MPELYSAIDLVVLPSHYEGFPTVLLEAAAMSLPVVATAIPGNVDAVRDQVTGILLPCRNAPGLAAAIRRYMDDPELGRSHGVLARERMLRDFRPEPIREFIRCEYDKLLKHRGLSSPKPFLNMPNPQTRLRWWSNVDVSPSFGRHRRGGGSIAAVPGHGRGRNCGPCIHRPPGLLSAA